MNYMREENIKYHEKFEKLKNGVPSKENNLKI